MIPSSKAARFFLVGALLLAGFAFARRPVAPALVEAGRAALETWQTERAESFFTWARRLDPESQQAAMESVALLQLLGRWNEAEDSLRLLSDRFRSDSSFAETRPRLACRTLLAEARDFRRRAKADEASRALNTALDLAVRHDLQILQLDIRLSRAELLYATEHRLDDAEGLLQQALEQATRLDQPELEAEALSSLGVLNWYYLRRRSRVVEDFYAPALEIYDQLGHLPGRAWVRGLMAVESMTRQDFAEAGRLLEASRRDVETLGSLSGKARLFTYLGALQTRLENHEQAFAHYQRAVELSDAGGDRLWAPRVRGLIAHLHLRRGEHNQALELLDRLLSETDLPITSRRDHLVTRGHANMHLGRPVEARAAYLEALHMDRQRPGRDAEVHANIYTMLAHAAMMEGGLRPADEHLRSAEAIPIREKGWGPTVMHTLARADLLDLQGRKQEALDQLVAAAEIESRTFGTARSHFFQTQYWQVFNRLFSLLFEGVLPVDDSQALVFRLLEQMRFRSFRSLVVNLHGRNSDDHDLPRKHDVAPRDVAPRDVAPERALERIETLSRQTPRSAAASAEHRRALRLAYLDYETHTLNAALSAASLKRVTAARPIELEVFQRHLPNSTALVEYVLAGDQPFVLVVRKDRLESAIIDTSVEQLSTQIKLFRHLLFDGQADERWRPLAHELHRLLISPLENQGFLRGIEDLVLIPMAPLHDLPFSALMDSQGSHLVERYQLARALSATAWVRGSLKSTATVPLQDASSQDASSQDRSSQDTWAFGLGRARGSELPELAYAEQEARAVAAVLGGFSVTGPQATEYALRRAANGARHLHIAGHGLWQPELPLHSHLELEAGDGHDGKLTVREILDLELHTELVTLSACNTALSKSGAANRGLEVDRLGFVEAFLHAGSSHVLAGLLPVSDRAGAELMTDFYQRLTDHAPHQALALAQRHMLHDRKGAGHPRFWSPFVLTGIQTSSPDPPQRP